MMSETTDSGSVDHRLPTPASPESTESKPSSTAGSHDQDEPVLVHGLSPRQFQMTSNDR